MSSISYLNNRYTSLFIFFILIPSFLFISSWLFSYISIFIGVLFSIVFIHFKNSKIKTKSTLFIILILSLISFLFYITLNDQKIYPIYYIFDYIKSITPISDSLISNLSILLSIIIGWSLYYLYIISFRNLFKLDRFMIISFLPAFISSFCIAVFILLMQFLWKWVDELIGKGLDADIIFQLIYYASARFIPLAIPIAILIASIMTFGNLGENSELSAMKSSGISLQKIMVPLIFFSILMVFSSFLYSNYLLPIANLKNGILLYDIQRKKPSVSIEENEFYTDIEGYSIKIEEKDNDKDKLYGIQIKEHKNNYKNDRTLLAKKGEMRISNNKKYLEIELEDPIFYNEIHDNKFIDHEKIIANSGVNRFNITKFGLNRSKESLYKKHYQMMSTRQLSRSIDSLNSDLKIKMNNFKMNYLKNFNFNHDYKRNEGLEYPGSLSKNEIKQYALNSINSNKSILKNYQDDILYRESILARHKIEWHRKLSLSFACIILFFVGSSLGSIVRKGGFSIPLLLSIILFVIYHVLNIIGEKQVKELLIHPLVGMWSANLIFLLLSIALLYYSKQESYLTKIFSNKK